MEADSASIGLYHAEVQKALVAEHAQLQEMQAIKEDLRMLKSLVHTFQHILPPFRTGDLITSAFTLVTVRMCQQLNPFRMQIEKYTCAPVAPFHAGGHGSNSMRCTSMQHT
eukprot:1160043-Pelagomonas_calceolata.AAC.1